MSPSFAREVAVETPTMDDGLRVDHPRLLEGIDTLLKKGYSNEHICRIIGVPGSVVDTRRSKMKKQA
jgi:hypothetical protein